MSNDTTTADAKINGIFKRHHDYYKELGYTTIEEQAGDIEQVSKDYEGRAIYELLQNAFDRAEKNILIKVTEDALYIANDGQHFTYAAEYDYENGNSTIRGDFQTLCSIHTSRKNRNESIGNKGVGFKSVFDISENDFVSIHTKGKIIDDKEIIDTGFKLCNLFDNTNKTEEIKCFDDKEKINNHIETIQRKKGFENRGVPGFYFPIPLHSDNRSANIQQIFLDERKFVTIIEIPLKQENFKKISDEVAKLEKDNFQFITLIHEKNITLSLNIFNEPPTIITIEKNTNYFFHAEITNNKEHLQKLAQNAGVSIKNYKVAICFNRPNEKIYNFLPTEKSSPLKNIDIHADFQTTIDRKGIDFTSKKIGAYNSGLLKACIELYFAVLNSYIDEEQRVQLQLEYIDQTKISSKLTDFDWSFFEFKTDAYDQIRRILTIYEWEYHSKSANLISRLAFKYFSHDNNKNRKNSYDEFYKSIQLFCNDQLGYKKNEKIDKHKQEIANALKSKENKVTFLPNVVKPWSYDQIFYKEESNELEFPDFLGIKITNYEIPDETIRKQLIKDSGSITELLKLYKQCSFDENTNEDTSEKNPTEKKQLTEEKQVELIRNLFNLVKDELDGSGKKSTPRFEYLFETNQDKNKIEAYFNISTIFLKTKNKKYKPAQLCKSEDIDLDFRKESIGCNIDCNNDEKVKAFLKFLGVSYDKELTFVDSRIYEKYNGGIDFPPSIVKISKPNDIKNLIENIRVIKKDATPIHPAIITYNKDYNFLEHIRPRKNSELDHVVKKYDNFPESYKKIFLTNFWDKLSEGYNREKIISFYQNNYKSLFGEIDKKLILINGKLECSTANDIIVILKKASDLKLCIKHYEGNKKLLCHHDEILAESIELKSEPIPKVNKPIEFTNFLSKENLSNDIDERLIHLLVEVSNAPSTLTKLNFLSVDEQSDDETEKSEKSKPSKIKELFDDLKVVEHETLKITYCLDGDRFDMDKSCHLDESLHLSKKYNKSDLAECLAVYLLGSASLTNTVDLVLFRRDINELRQRSEKDHIKNIKKQLLNDAKCDHRKFFNAIKDEIKITHDYVNDWYIYPSKLLRDLDHERKLDLLKSAIKEIKETEEYHECFSDFELEIDYSKNDREIAVAIAQIDENNAESKIYIQKIKEISLKTINVTEHLFKVMGEIPDDLLVKDTKPNGKVINLSNELSMERKIEGLMSNLSKKFEVIHDASINLESAHEVTQILTRDKKEPSIKANDTQETKDTKKETGNNGEVRVVSSFINSFIGDGEFNLAQNKDEYCRRIEAIWKLIQDKIKNLQIYKDNCLTVINDENSKREDLFKALLSLCYYTLHNENASFDLVIFDVKTQQAKLIEVKSTKNQKMSKFHLSPNEINTARSSGDSYEIIIVTPERIESIGNPIKKLESHLTQINSDKFELIPKGYEFIFKN